MVARAVMSTTLTAPTSIVYPRIRDAANQLAAFDPVGLLLLDVTCPTVCSTLVKTPSFESAKYRIETATNKMTQPTREIKKLNFMTDHGSIRSIRSCARRACGLIGCPGVSLACGRAPAGRGGCPLPGGLRGGVGVFTLGLLRLETRAASPRAASAAAPAAALTALGNGVVVDGPLGRANTEPGGGAESPGSGGLADSGRLAVFGSTCSPRAVGSVAAAVTPFFTCAS